MPYHTELKSAPSFTFYQEDDDNQERAINVTYYNGSIELEQGNETILVITEFIEPLFRAIKKQLPKALEVLELRKRNS